MHAQHPAQQQTPRWHIPHSEYTTLQELVAAGGQASITLLAGSVMAEPRAIQLTCHVTTTRQHDLPDVSHALRADLLIPGQPLQHVECRAWLDELVSAIQRYANSSQPLPPSVATAAEVPGTYTAGCANACPGCTCRQPPLLIGLTGKARSGKTTAAEWLNLHHGFDMLSFADPIKRMLSMLGLTRSELDGEHKETIIPALGKSPRQLMQTLGTEWGRQQVHPDLWVMAAEAMLDGHPTVFVDVRFENEAAMVRARAGTILHIIREQPGITVGSDHASESGINIHDDDLVLHNNCALDGIGGMHAQLDAAVALIRQRAAHTARQHPDSEAA